MSRTIPRSAGFLYAFTLLCFTGSQARAQTFTGESISAFANIFGAGNPSNPTPHPGGGSGGIAAPEFDLTSGMGRVLTFQSVSGIISLTPGTSSVPDGLQPNGNPPLGLDTNISSFQGISGIRLEKGSGFLVGVFLSNAMPTNPAPPLLEFTNNGTTGLINTDFASLSPVLDQTFFIGDGLTGNGTGNTQTFYVPDDATRLFLGYADANGYSGAPGQYQDNSGSVTASFQVTSVPEPSTLMIGATALLSLGLVALRRRRMT